VGLAQRLEGVGAQEHHLDLGPASVFIFCGCVRGEGALFVVEDLASFDPPLPSVVDDEEVDER